MRTSIIATTVRNAQCAKKEDLVPLDYFVPKRVAAPKQNDLPDEVKDLARQVIAMDMAIAKVKGNGGVVAESAIEKREAAVKRLREMKAAHLKQNG